MTQPRCEAVHSTCHETTFFHTRDDWAQIIDNPPGQKLPSVRTLTRFVDNWVIHVIFKIGGE